MQLIYHRDHAGVHAQLVYGEFTPKPPQTLVVVDITGPDQDKTLNELMKIHPYPPVLQGTT